MGSRTQLWLAPVDRHQGTTEESAVVLREDAL